MRINGGGGPPRLDGEGTAHLLRIVARHTADDENASSPIVDRCGGRFNPPVCIVAIAA